ncbi:DUF2288 domain-containing protein [Pandoraea sp. XJJ-1]|uniref:DUF2288 domain-containing protein n=1 Tax=unclassified Pandoraea TaxID=2624094 RepID=UPI00034BAE37|nr:MULTISPECIES: DUF2288 domain-containing protein [unclassified Pandoraea]MBN9114073.1 DUF2288 domain-containing protein [Pandoraea sp.]OJY21171.1 MAG: hypothetical protein BGP02_19070 [Pandoraea sp. 64-18]WAL82992.1 DUF2288 domain-containing protein [Pandoraea sp. XJJ-1]BDD91839.1 hypothetical protein PanNE5_12790 [Pandoraea sp. NE5]
MDSPKSAQSVQASQAAASGASDVYLRLLGETAKIDWKDLESFFARGVLLYVAPGVDLVSVAEAVANDDKATVSQWLSSALVQRMQAEQAADFSARTPELWAVVVAPWVLVQERGIVA